MKVFLVDTIDELETLAKTWINKKCLAIDTEFERRTTFYAKLALVQVYDGDSIYLIDPLTIDCPSSLKQVLESNDVIKIFHSSKEDLEVLYTSWNCYVTGLFDTQVAYNFLHDELSVGYAKLVEEMTGAFVSKQQTTSDWTKRPLSSEQLSYAAKDVLYLIDIYYQLENELLDKNYRQFFIEECEEYCNGVQQRIDSIADFREAKDVWQLNEEDLEVFKLLFIWRENRAKQDNRTKNHIIRDQALVQLSKIKPNNINQLKTINDIHPRSLRLYACEWFDIISQWQASEKHPIPAVKNPRDVKQLKQLSIILESTVKIVAKKYQISNTLLLSKRVIRKLAYAILTNETKPLQWHGWRKKLLENTIKEQIKPFITRENSLC